MPKFKSKEEWSNAVNQFKAKNGTTRGFQSGKLQYIDSAGETWSYAAGTRGGPGHPRRASSTTAYTDRRDAMEINQTLGAENLKGAKKIFNEAGRAAGVENGVHNMHHMRTLNQFEPLLAGLSPADTQEALKWFVSEGHPLGNLDGNLKKQFKNQKAGGLKISDTHQGLGSIHEFMRQNRLEPSTDQKEYQQIAKMFEGKSLNERLPMFVQYLDNIQAPVQEKLEEPTLYSRRADLERSVGTIQSGLRAGQRLPVNRRTLGDAIIRDIVKPPLSEVAKSAFESEILDKVPPNAFASVVSSKVPPKTTSAPQSTVRTPTTTPSTPKPTQTKTKPTGYVHRNRTPSETPPVTVSRTPPPTVLENLNTGLQNTLKIGGAIGAGALAIGKDMLFGFNP